VPPKSSGDGDVDGVRIVGERLEIRPGGDATTTAFWHAKFIDQFPTLRRLVVEHQPGDRVETADAAGRERRCLPDRLVDSRRLFSSESSSSGADLRAIQKRFRWNG